MTAEKSGAKKTHPVKPDGLAHVRRAKRKGPYGRNYPIAVLTAPGSYRLKIYTLLLDSNEFLIYV